MSEIDYRFTNQSHICMFVLIIVCMYFSAWLKQVHSVSRFLGLNTKEVWSQINHDIWINVSMIFLQISVIDWKKLISINALDLELRPHVYTYVCEFSIKHMYQQVISIDRCFLRLKYFYAHLNRFIIVWRLSIQYFTLTTESESHMRNCLYVFILKKLKLNAQSLTKMNFYTVIKYLVLCVI